MKSIIQKWILYSIGICFIPVFLLGASPGGIALSPIIIAFGIIIGLVGSSFHVVVISLYKGDTRQRVFAFSYSVMALFLVSWGIYKHSECNLTEAEAMEIVVSHRWNGGYYEMKELGQPIFSAENCTYSFPYKSPKEYKEVLVDSLQDIYLISK